MANPGPADVAPVEPAAPEAGQPAQQGGWAMLKGFIFRMAMIYFVSSLFRTWSGGGQQNVRPSNATAPAASYGPPGHNLFPKGCSFDVYVYLSDHSHFTDFDNESALYWQISDLTYGDWESGPNRDGSYSYTREFPTPDSLKSNGSLFMHVFVSRENSPINPRDPEYKRRNVVHSFKRLNKYKKKKYQKTSNLLTGETGASADHIKKAETIKYEILNHWHPNITINFVDDHTAWVKGSLPPPLDTSVKFDPVTGNYYPILFFNDYWNLQSEYSLINETVERVNLTITFSPMSLFKWQIYASQTMRNKWTQMLSGSMDDESDEDQDSLKQAILETNPYLLGATIVVSLLHTVFEFLAFKNDIQFWRSRKSLEGLSVRSVLFNVFTTVIVLLYVFDNDTNFVVRISIGIGLLIELWKIPKVLDVSLDYEHRFMGLPRPRYADKGTYVESNTKEYDRMAFKYLAWVLFPLLAGYCVYSLTYNEHRGWYSFVLSMLYGYLLLFGFIMMTPQLFINYKLKSVAHLPWRMLTYKFLNTFIDDIFAFVIKMPTMYRIGCFRDDIVFLIYLYQRWIYRVDPKRMNEFGTSGENPEGALENEAVPTLVPAICDADAASLANGATGDGSDQEPEPEPIEEGEKEAVDVNANKARKRQSRKT